jgi:hypothetical protein
MTIDAIIIRLGGYRALAHRLGRKPTTVHSAIRSGRLPSAWYDALCQICAREGLAEPERELFRFLRLPERRGDT